MSDTHALPQTQAQSIAVAGSRHYAWKILFVLTTVLILLPICALFFSIFTPFSEPLTYLWQHKIPASIVTTLLLLVCTAVSTLFFGTSTAWLLTRYHIPGGHIFVALLILPLAIPSYVNAYTVAAAVNFNAFCMAWYVLTFSLTPYVFIISRFAFQRESRLLFDAAQMQGIRFPFLRLALPMARPALIGAIVLVSMEVLNEYGTFIYLGIETLTTIIFKLWFNHYDIRGAVQLSSYMFIAIVIIAAVEYASRQRTVYTQPYTELHHYSPVRIHVIARICIYLYCLIPIICGALFPIISLCYWSIAEGGSLFMQRSLWIALAHTIGIATMGAVLCLMAALVLTYGSRLVRHRMLIRLATWSTFGYAIPGAIIAIAILQLGGTLIATISIVLLLYGYTTRYLAVCYHPLESAFTQQCACTDEIAQSLGANHWKRLREITLPQLRIPIIAATILIVFEILKELPLTIILRPIGVETLALQSFYYAHEEQMGYAAPSAILMCLLGGIILLLTQRSIKAK